MEKQLKKLIDMSNGKLNKQMDRISIKEDNKYIGS